ncbi:uncharacterized protein LOC126979723 isoform X2 [Leptidea sinapis]|uniref:uncharacterized protein LOC126979723 isoform X2 n=1 Tax=Leptidea sinapis TaxID=189913 RepID=UPI0021C3FB2C|nr:uncharacterized protein LOC126979723 isoform X2 [Leptidea sinapis]
MQLTIGSDRRLSCWTATIVSEVGVWTMCAMQCALSPWQGRAECGVVLQCVLERMSAEGLDGDEGVAGEAGRAVLRFGAVCRDWRRAALDSALWRRLVAPRVTPVALRTLADARALSLDHVEWSWKVEGLLCLAEWRQRGRLGSAESAPLVHAALDPPGYHLAVLSEDGQLRIWEHVSKQADEDWVERCNLRVSGEWRGGGRVCWGPQSAGRRGRTLLVSGSLLLAERCEVQLLHITGEDQYDIRVLCRGTCSLGTEPCWWDHSAFLTLRVQLLAPGLACTTVWLNSVTQESHSEHAGVMMPLLRIFNEAGANISHMLIADTPISSRTFLDERSKADLEDVNTPNANYYWTILTAQVISSALVFRRTPGCLADCQTT